MIVTGTMDSRLGDNKSSIELNDSVVAGDVIVNQQTTRKIVCGKCGKMGDFNSYFCSDCDSRVCEECYSRTKKRCWPCNTEREKTLSDCRSCGKEFRWKESHMNKIFDGGWQGKIKCNECYKADKIARYGNDGVTRNASRQDSMIRHDKPIMIWRLLWLSVYIAPILWFMLLPENYNSKIISGTSIFVCYLPCVILAHVIASIWRES